MPTCAFLTLGELTADDALTVAPLSALGWQVTGVHWQEDHDWTRFDRVVIRSPWDYHRKPAQFLPALERIAEAGVRLDNSLSLVRWNLCKRYLEELAGQGIAIVPTEWPDALEPAGLSRLLASGSHAEFIVKPVISASADRTYRIGPSMLHEELTAIETAFQSDQVMIQPLVRSVLDEGEYSLIYFAGRFSHAVLKSAARGDFRVQSDFGGQMTLVSAEDELLATGEAAIGALPEQPLYARVDLVRADSGPGFWLMEVELIEPSLCLRHDPGAAARFAAAIASG